MERTIKISNCQETLISSLFCDRALTLLFCVVCVPCFICGAWCLDPGKSV